MIELNMIPFAYDRQEVRTILKVGEPWFVAKDVCRILGLENVAKALLRIPKCHRGVNPIHTRGGVQQMSIVSEPGLYRLTLRSNKPQAEPFMEWVTAEVLPAIRKTGGAYLTAQKAEELLANPDLIIVLAQQVKQLKAESKAKQQVIEDLSPKAHFADMASDSKNSISIIALIGFLRKNGIKVDLKWFINWLRECGYLRWGELLPTQCSIELGLFQVREHKIMHPNGQVGLIKASRITSKGQLHLLNKLLKGCDITA